MKVIITTLILCFSFSLVAQETITDFNPPLWNYGTGNGADATGAGTIDAVPYTIDFSRNGGTKLFIESGVKPNQYTSNSSIGHGGPPNSLLLGGVDEGLTFTFDVPVNIILGLSHVNNDTDGWDFITPADEVVSLHGEHKTVITGGSITGVRQNLVGTTTNTNNTSTFKWNNVTSITIQTVGQAGTTLALSSMTVTNLSPASVPSLSTWGVLILISLFGFIVLRSETVRLKY